MGLHYLSMDLFTAYSKSMFVCFNFLRPSQQFFSHVSMGLPGLSQSDGTS